MKKIDYLTSDGVETLHSAVKSRWRQYYDGNPILDIPETKTTNLYAKSSLADILICDSTAPEKHDAENALRVYEALDCLNPAHATEERLWVYLCHTEAFDYVSNRFLATIPDSSEKAIKKVSNHFFANNRRVRFRDNGVSRLWWLGYVAHQVDKQNPQEFLEILLHKQDVRASVLERPFISTNRKILKSIYSVMRDHWRNDNHEIFERQVFRDWMKGLNRRGGVILLDSLSDDDLDKLIRQELESCLVRRK